MIIGIYNNKGGVGKTILADNLSYELSKKGKKVCIIDLDAQGNATEFFSIKADCNIADAITGRKNVLECAVNSAYENLDVIASSKEIEKCFVGDSESSAIVDRLKQTKDKLNSTYDYTIVDLPPNFVGYTRTIVNDLTDCIVVPMVCSAESILGFDNIFEFLYSNNIKLASIVISRYNKNFSFMREYKTELLKSPLNEFISSAIINECGSIGKATAEKKPASLKYKSNNNCQAFRKLAEELIERGC